MKLTYVPFHISNRAREQKKKDDKARKKAAKEQKMRDEIAAEKQKKERVRSSIFVCVCVYITYIIIFKLTVFILDSTHDDRELPLKRKLQLKKPKRPSENCSSRNYGMQKLP